MENQKRFGRLRQQIYALWKKIFENYAYLWLFAMATALVVCFLCGLIADPEHPAQGLFFIDHHDVGMDHFNSVFVTAERTPYTRHHITYPPLAAMISPAAFRVSLSASKSFSIGKRRGSCRQMSMTHFVATVA